MDQDNSDEDLVKSFQAFGNKKAVLLLMRRYSGYIVAFGMRQFKDREKVKDFTQDLFVKLCDKLKTSDVKHFNSWLHTIMRNMFYDKVRREQLHDRFEDLQKGKPEHYEIESEMDRAAEAQILQNAIDQLNPEEARCVRMIYLEELDYKEVMKATGWTFNQVRGYRQRGMLKLKALLGKQKGADG